MIKLHAVPSTVRFTAVFWRHAGASRPLLALCVGSGRGQISGLFAQEHGDALLVYTNTPGECRRARQAGWQSRQQLNPVYSVLRHGEKFKYQDNSETNSTR